MIELREFKNNENTNIHVGEYFVTTFKKPDKKTFWMVGQLQFKSAVMAVQIN